MNRNTISWLNNP